MIEMKLMTHLPLTMLLTLIMYPSAMWKITIVIYLFSLFVFLLFLDGDQDISNEIGGEVEVQPDDDDMYQEETFDALPIEPVDETLEDVVADGHIPNLSNVFWLRQGVDCTKMLTPAFRVQIFFGRILQLEFGHFQLFFITFSTYESKKK